MERQELIEKLEAWVAYRKLDNVWHYPAIEEALRDLLMQALSHLKEKDDDNFLLR